MQRVDPDDPRLQHRPLIGMVILTLPLVLLVGTVIAYAGMVGLGLRGRPADLERELRSAGLATEVVQLVPGVVWEWSPQAESLAT